MNQGGTTIWLYRLFAFFWAILSYSEFKT